MDQSIGIGGKKVNVKVLGKGKSIIFVHGWGGSSESLLPIAEQLSKKYQCVLLDLPGFGKSDMPEKTWGIPEYAEIIAKVIMKLNLKEVSYFGHSFGGTLGIYLTVNFPDLVEKLVICAASYRRKSKQKIAQGQNPVKRIFQKLTFLRKIYYKLFFPGSDLMKFPKLEENFKKIVAYDLSLKVNKITKQTLILWGELDKETPIADAHYLNDNVKNSELKIYENAGHSLPLRQPKEIVKDIDNFLAR